MIKIGITGSIGMGKSTTARMFKEISCAHFNSSRGCSVFDSDKAVHQLYEDKAIPIIEKVFPDSLTDGRIDRKKLGELVIGNSRNMEILEKKIHPLVRDETLNFIKKSEDDGVKMAVVDIPLLYETGAQDMFDFVVVATADAEIQRNRVHSREGMTEQMFENILSRQISDRKKREFADYLVDTGNGMEYAENQVRNIVQDITKKSVENL